MVQRNLRWISLETGRWKWAGAKGEIYGKGDVMKQGIRAAFTFFIGTISTNENLAVKVNQNSGML
jgi:hypothetical protein